MLRVYVAQCMLDSAPNHLLTSIIDDWNPSSIERVHAVLKGTWKSQDV